MQCITYPLERNEENLSKLTVCCVRKGHVPHYHELFSHVGQRGKFQKSHDANTNILTRHMIWVEKLPEGMHWLVKIIKKCQNSCSLRFRQASTI